MDVRSRATTPIVRERQSVRHAVQIARHLDRPRPLRAGHQRQRPRGSIDPLLEQLQLDQSRNWRPGGDRRAVPGTGWAEHRIECRERSIIEDPTRDDGSPFAAHLDGQPGNRIIRHRLAQLDGEGRSTIAPTIGRHGSDRHGRTVTDAHRDRLARLLVERP